MKIHVIWDNKKSDILSDGYGIPVVYHHAADCDISTVKGYVQLMDIILATNGSDYLPRQRHIDTIPEYQEWHMTERDVNLMNTIIEMIPTQGSVLIPEELTRNYNVEIHRI